MWLVAAIFDSVDKSRTFLSLKKTVSQHLDNHCHHLPSVYKCLKKSETIPT